MSHRKSILRTAMEAVNAEENGVVLKGPLSDVYAAALDKVYSKEAPVTKDGDSSTTGVSDAALESADKPKVKVKKGGFHEWLGKKKDEPITDADIEKGLKSKDPHVRKMAQFAKNAKKWKHNKKIQKQAPKKKSKSTEDFDENVFDEPITGAELDVFSQEKTADVVTSMESQQIDTTIIQRLLKSMGNASAPPTNNFTTIYGVSRQDADDNDVVNVAHEVAGAVNDDRDFILVIDGGAPLGESGEYVQDISPDASAALETIETLTNQSRFKVCNSLHEAVKLI